MTLKWKSERYPDMSSELTVLSPKELYQTATDVAGLCKDAVSKTAVNISGKKYIKVEGWQTIGAAHGCIAEIESIEETEIEGVTGLKCWSKLVRVSDQAVLSRASAFLGNDESQDGISGKKYARYAKVQTRAISRVLSNAFRFVVVLMNAGLETTPAEEMPRDVGDGKGADTGSVGTPSQIEEQILEGILDSVSEKGEWMTGFCKGVQFGTKKPDLKEKMSIFVGSKVKIRVKKFVKDGRTRFFPESIESVQDVVPEEEEAA